jgi:hypothetical protein
MSLDKALARVNEILGGRGTVDLGDAVRASYQVAGEIGVDPEQLRNLVESTRNLRIQIVEEPSSVSESVEPVGFPGTDWVKLQEALRESSVASKRLSELAKENRGATGIEPYLRNAIFVTALGNGGARRLVAGMIGVNGMVDGNPHRPADALKHLSDLAGGAADLCGEVSRHAGIKKSSLRVSASAEGLFRAVQRLSSLVPTKTAVKSDPFHRGINELLSMIIDMQRETAEFISPENTDPVWQCWRSALDTVSGLLERILDGLSLVPVLEKAERLELLPFKGILDGILRLTGGFVGIAAPFRPQGVSGQANGQS